jgi:Alpha amylase, catalytic domain
VWFKGSVFYEIFPASFQDSNRDGIGDLNGITSRIDYLQHLGVAAVRLNSIFPSKNYPDHFEQVTSLTDVDDALGKVGDVAKLSVALQARNISLVLDIPVYPFITQLNASKYVQTDVVQKVEIIDPETSIVSEYARLSRSLALSNETNLISNAIRFWLSNGVHGFYLKGLENLHTDPHLVDNFKEWRHLLGPHNMLMVSETLMQSLNEKEREEVAQLVDLVDVHLNVSQPSDGISGRIKSVLAENTPENLWVHWTIGSGHQTRIASHLSPNMSLAVTLMELMLPGTINIFYGDEISMNDYDDPSQDYKDMRHLQHLPTMAWNSSKFTSAGVLPWLPSSASVSHHHLEFVVDLIQLRKKSPSIYLNSLMRDQVQMSNTNIRSNIDDLFIVERWYPRRNSFVSITNFGAKNMTEDLTKMFYSGQLVLSAAARNSKVYFNKFEIESLETVVVRLDK